MESSRGKAMCLPFETQDEYLDLVADSTIKKWKFFIRLHLQFRDEVFFCTGKTQ